MISTPVRAADVSDRTARVLALPVERALSLRLTIGHVRIIGEARTDAHLEVVRQAPDASLLARIPLTIEARADAVEINAVQADGGTDSALRTDVTLRVPARATIDTIQILEGRLDLRGVSGSVRADVRRGPIDAASVSGTLRLETEIGNVVVRDARLVAGGLLRLRTFNGDVQLNLAERPSDARILALALNGTLASDIPLTMKDTWGPRWGETTIGSGQNVISIDVVTGNVEIRAR